MKEDTQQFKFNINGNLDKPLNNKKSKKINLTETVYCPFCLVKGKLRQFLTSSKDGISTYKAKCFECGKGMLLRTVNNMCNMNDAKIRSYADWVYLYRLNGFWQKINMDVWSKRLKEYKWNITFWSRYKQLKGQVNKEEDDYDY